jgi:hypothetical protein
MQPNQLQQNGSNINTIIMSKEEDKPSRKLGAGR